MKSDLQLDVEAVRGCASALADTGARVAAGAARAPSPVSEPRWPAADAAADLAGAASGRIIAIGSDLAAAARQIAASADDYEAADRRSALRLRAVR
jgi:hypothetical protein